MTALRVQLSDAASAKLTKHLAVGHVLSIEEARCKAVRVQHGQQLPLEQGGGLSFSKAADRGERLCGGGWKSGSCNIIFLTCPCTRTSENNAVMAPQASLAQGESMQGIAT